jgi:hypothetical protein
VTAAERFLELGLRLGRHVEGLVDAYYGPAELKERVDAEEPVPPERLAAAADELLSDVPDDWLADQVRGCATYARVLAGEPISYSDEVEQCYGVRPEPTPLSIYEAAHAELDELLPGDGTLFERREAWRERHLCPGDRAVGVMEALLPLLRRRTLTLLDLPDGEEATIEPVSDEPWWAYNYYLGDFRSRVAFNTDLPTTGTDLVKLVAHELYPGHHTEHAAKEQLLLRGRGLLEEGLQLVPTPQAVLSEGIAEVGEELVLDDAAREEAYSIIRRHGLELVDPELSRRIATALEPLRPVGVDAALQIYEHDVPVEEAQKFVERWSLVSPEQAAHSIRFVRDPTWRAYVITYSAGRDLCRAYVDGDPVRFRTLLTEHVRIGELLAAAG